MVEMEGYPPHHRIRRCHLWIQLVPRTRPTENCYSRDYRCGMDDHGGLADRNRISEG